MLSNLQNIACERDWQSSRLWMHLHGAPTWTDVTRGIGFLCHTLQSQPARAVVVELLVGCIRTLYAFFMFLFFSLFHSLDPCLLLRCVVRSLQCYAGLARKPCSASVHSSIFWTMTNRSLIHQQVLSRSCKEEQHSSGNLHAKFRS